MSSVIKKIHHLEIQAQHRLQLLEASFASIPSASIPPTLWHLICCPHKAAGATRCDDPTEFFSPRFHTFLSLICFVHRLLSSWSPRRMRTPIYSRKTQRRDLKPGMKRNLIRIQRSVCTAGHSSTLGRNLETLNPCTCYCLVWGDDCHAITITVSTHPVISRVYSWHRFFHLVCHVFIIKHPHTGGHISYFLYAIIKYQGKASQGRKDYISGF